VSVAVKVALASFGATMGDSCLKTSVHINVHHGEAVEVTHTRTEMVMDKEEKAEFVWSCCFMLDRKEVGGVSVPAVKVFLQ
jgi:hypothetical protein